MSDESMRRPPCGVCDPSYGCFDGSEACGRRPVVPAAAARPAPTLRLTSVIPPRLEVENLIARLRGQIDQLDCMADCGECKACLLFEAREQLKGIEQRIAEAVAKEREAIARMAEELDGAGGGPIVPCSFVEFAASIRARTRETP